MTKLFAKIQSQTKRLRGNFKKIVTTEEEATEYKVSESCLKLQTRRHESTVVSHR